MRGRTRAVAGGKLASTQIITCVHTGVVAERRRSGTNFPRPLRNRALQAIIVLKKWQIRPRLLRVCVNIPAVAERGCQNMPVSAPQPLRACVNVALYSATMIASSSVVEKSIEWHLCIYATQWRWTLTSMAMKEGVLTPWMYTYQN